jgi:hypothetical protein
MFLPLTKFSTVNKFVILQIFYVHLQYLNFLITEDSLQEHLDYLPLMKNFIVIYAELIYNWISSSFILVL